ncbi:MAG: HEAT repeat domain-containing protein, partial [Planctomycetota bacterium]
MLQGRSGRSALPPGTDALRDQNARVAEAAARAIGMIGAEATPVLVRALRNPEAKIRGAAARGLGRFGPDAKEAVVPLRDALVDEDAYVRLFAAEALGSIGPDAAEAVPALVKVIREDGVGRKAALVALGEIGPAAIEAVPALENIVDDRQLHCCWAALALFRVSPDRKDEALSALVAMTEDSFYGARVAAAQALGQIGVDPGVVARALRGRLRDRNEHVRRAAVKALGKITPPSDETVLALVRALQDDGASHMTYWCVTEALAEIGPKAKAAVPVLIKLLRADVAASRNSSRAAWALGRIGVGTDEVERALSGYLRDTDWRPRQAAFLAASEIGAPAVPILIAVLRDGK